MKTPFKLKRDAPSSITTLDRTVLLSNKSSLRPKDYPVQPLLSQPIAKPVQSVIEVERVNTSELQKQMAKLMQEEETRSQRNRSGAKGGHCYFTRPLQSKLAIGASWPVPQRVKELYDKVSKGGRCEFNRGILMKAGLYYFAVQNIVLFYDITRAITSAGRLDDHFAHKAEFDITVYELKELSWKHSYFGQFKNKPIILVSHPWAIGFAALEIEAGQGKGARWMRITTLNSTFTHGSSVARCIVEGKLQIYFLDDSGKISCVSITETGLKDYLFTKNLRKHKLQQQTRQLGGTSSFYACRKATTLEKIRHFSKVVLTKAFNFYGRRVVNHDLVSDTRGNLLISLVDLDATSDRSALSAFKVLTCWDRRGGKLNKKWEVSELQFFDKEIEPIADHSNHHNYRIARIQAIDHHYDSQCSLIVFLNCGMRLYIKAEDSSRVVHYHLPPALDGQLHHKAEPRQHSKSLDLGHCLSWWNTNVMTLREEQGDIHTFLICRSKENREREECVELVWGNSMCRGKSGNPPEESHLIRFCLTSAAKEKIAQTFATSVLHEMNRGLFGGPEFLVNSTDQGVEYLCNLRPVDRVFAAIQSTLDDEHVLMKVLADLPEVEIQYLLLQIYCDPNGQYLKDLQLIECMTQYQRRLLSHGGEDFDPFQRDFYEQKAQNRTEEDLLPLVVDRETITQQTNDKILEMILKLAKKPQGVAGHAKLEAEVHASFCNAVLLYLSRLLKKIWKISINQLTKSIQIILPMIYPLHKVVSYFSASAVTKTKLIHHSVTSTRPLVRFGKEKQEDSEKKVLGKGLKEISSYLHKLTQLIILCAEINISLDKSFSMALSLESQSFEKPIFDFLIEKYEKPALSLVQYKKHFPSLIGENLEKSLKIFEECKSKKKEEVVAILKYHRQIQVYLLNYYESKSVLRPDDIKEIRGHSSLSRPEKQRIDYSNVKDNIHTCLQELSKQGHDFSQRGLLILRASALLKHYLNRNDGKQDRFYRESHMQLEDVRRKIEFQELMLDEYKVMDKQLSSQIVMQLRTYLFDEEKLYQLQKDLGSFYLTVVFFLLFGRVEADQKEREIVLDCVQNIIEKDCKDAEAETIVKKALSYLQSKKGVKGRWHNFNRLVKIVVKNTSSFPLNTLIDILSEAIMRTLGPKLNEEVLRLGEIITRHGGKQRMLEVGKRMEIPLISITFLEAGVQGSELNSYYEQWLRQRKGGQEGLLHSINILFLTLRVEPRWEFLLANFKDVCTHFQQPVRRILEESCKLIAEASGWNDSFL